MQIGVDITELIKVQEQVGVNGPCCKAHKHGHDEEDDDLAVREDGCQLLYGAQGCCLLLNRAPHLICLGATEA